MAKDMKADDRTAKMMQSIAQALDENLNPGTKGAARKIGFAVLVFPMDTPNPLVNYVSNGQREDMQKAMKSLLARWDNPNNKTTVQ